MEFAQCRGAMASHAPSPSRQRGFTLIEIIVVVAIVAILAAIAFPNIAGYIKNYRIKGAAQLVAGELNAARSKAIMSNTNNGVSFVVLDRDHFRFVLEDIDIGTEPDPSNERFSGIKQLPTGVEFVGIDGGPATLRFQRLGGFCVPGTSTCRAALDEPLRHTVAEAALLDPGTRGSGFILADASGAVEIRVREASTSLERTVQVAPGGRVLPQP